MADTSLAPTGLLCELMENPESAYLCKKRPGFGWIVQDSAPNAIQAAYQILVASSIKTLAQDAGDLWDSGKVGSCESVNIRYDGAPLKSNTTYYWKARARGMETLKQALIQNLRDFAQAKSLRNT